MYYDNPPSQPSAADLASSPGGPCAGPDAPALVATVPTVSARLSDPDIEQISGEFRAVWDDASGHHEWDSPLLGPKFSGSTFSTPLPSSLPRQVTVQWSARAYDGTAYGPWNDATGCYLSYDNSAT